MKRQCALLLPLLLAACSGEPPAAFEPPATELERIVDATDASCEMLRNHYWFCQANTGFVHLYTEQPKGSLEPIVSMVMLEADAATNANVASLYGFEDADLAAISPGQPAVQRGAFVLVLDSEWKLPVIRLKGD